MHNCKSTYILLALFFINLLVYPQQDTTVNKLPSEQTINDSVIVNVQPQEDSSITKTSSEHNVEDSVSVDEQLQQDSSLYCDTYHMRLLKIQSKRMTRLNSRLCDYYQKATAERLK